MEPFARIGCAVVHPCCRGRTRRMHEHLHVGSIFSSFLHLTHFNPFRTRSKGSHGDWALSVTRRVWFGTIRTLNFDLTNSPYFHRQRKKNTCYSMSCRRFPGHYGPAPFDNFILVDTIFLVVKYCLTMDRENMAGPVTPSDNFLVM